MCVGLDIMVFSFGKLLNLGVLDYKGGGHSGGEYSCVKIFCYERFRIRSPLVYLCGVCV